MLDHHKPWGSLGDKYLKANVVKGTCFSAKLKRFEKTNAFTNYQLTRTEISINDGTIKKKVKQSHYRPG